MIVDPAFAHWIVIAPVVLAVIVGILARWTRHRDEVKEALRYVRKVRRKGRNENHD